MILSWTTASEADIAGFNLYRLEAKGGKALKINAALIPVKGAGQAYEVTDTNVTNRKTYYYRLESVDKNGATTLLDIMSATPRLFILARKVAGRIGRQLQKGGVIETPPSL